MAAKETVLTRALTTIIIGILPPIIGYCQVDSISFYHLDFRDGFPKYCLAEAVAQDQSGKVWFGNDRGLYTFDGYAIRAFSANIVDSTMLPEEDVQALFCHPDGTMWIGHRKLGLSVYNPLTGRIRRFLPREIGGTFPANRVWDIYLDSQGVIWIPTEEGLVECDTSTFKFTLHLMETRQLQPAIAQYANIFRTVIDDPVNPDFLWTGGGLGLSVFDKKARTFTRKPMPYTSDEVDYLRIDYLILDMLWHGDAELWLGTWSGGLLCFDKETDSWKRYRNPYLSQKDDVTHNVIKVNDSTFLTNNTETAYIFHLTTKNFEALPTTRESADGLLWSNYFNGGLITYDRVFVTQGNLGASLGPLPVSNTPIDTLAPPVITEMRVNHIAYLSDTAMAFKEYVEFEEKPDNLSISIAAPNFREPDSIRYKYRLGGFEKDWVYGTGKQNIQYTNLPSGSYVFEFAASANDEDWIYGEHPLRLTIASPWWLTPAFLVPAIGLLLATISAFIYLQLRAFKRETRLRAEFNGKLAENEMTALRAQMNPHFMFNSLNSIRNYILNEDTAKADKYLTRFSKLMRAILQNSKNKLITLEDELNALKLYIEIEAMRFNNEFSYHIGIDEDLETSKLLIPPLLIQPYVENAIWHGLMMKKGKRQLHVTLHPINGDVQIIVADNGIGRARSAQLRSRRTTKKKSYGMQITADRISLINKALQINTKVRIEDQYDDQGVAAGTKVIITIPKMQAEEYVYQNEKLPQ